MSVVVDKLTKIYGQQKALDGISFEAPKGQITGFLGPNGAGKSTTMKIATGYISATAGSVEVAGIDVSSDPLAAKRITGYLPEHNPLYLDMYVVQYLEFISKAYRLVDSKEKIERVIDQCGLEAERSKRISALSKGYRQRVGLAQALLPDPEVLILDEPTSGLDPNQLVEIREVIKTASQDKTVILSTHIMQEVEALCDKVVIINEGAIVADDVVGNLKSDKAVPAYLVEFEELIDVELFEKEGLDVSPGAERVYKISGEVDPRKQIMQIVSKHELPLVNIAKQEQSLEKVFQELTQDS